MRKAINVTQEALKDQVLLRCTRSEIIDLAVNFTKFAIVKEGDYICFQGDPQAPLIFLVEGQLRLSTYSEDGIEIPIGVINPRHCVGDVSILNRVPICANVAAAKVSAVGLLDRTHARQLLNDPDVARSLNNLMAERCMGMVMERSSHSKSRAGARVIAAIEATIDKRLSSECQLIELPNQSTIAAMAKVSRETVSRVITSLEKRGVIEREGKSIRIRDRVALCQLASDYVAG